MCNLIFINPITNTFKGHARIRKTAQAVGHKYPGNNMEDILYYRVVPWGDISFVLFKELFITFCIKLSSRQLIAKWFDRASPGVTFDSASGLMAIKCRCPITNTHSQQTHQLVR